MEKSQKRVGIKLQGRVPTSIVVSQNGQNVTGKKRVILWSPQRENRSKGGKI